MTDATQTQSTESAVVLNTTPAAIRSTVLRVVDAFTNGLSTTDKKGNRVSFERSIAFASKDSRLDLAGKVYAKQCEAGRYHKLVVDSLAGGVLNKSQRELFDAMIGGADVNKEIAQRFCAAVVHMDDNARAAGKAAKGQKAFYIGMLRSLHTAINAGDVVAAG